MLKTLSLTVLFVTVLRASSTCDSCSPECLDCRVRGFSRLSADHYSADCYLEYAVGGMLVSKRAGATQQLVPSACVDFPGAILVCQQQRCSLDNGERCKLLALNASQCSHYLSSENSALDSTLSGCFSYAPATGPGAAGLCAPGYTALCKFTTTDFISTLDSTLVYTPITGQPAFRTQEISPPNFDLTLNPSATPCDPYSLPLANGVVGKLVLEACISPVSGLVASNWASVMQENFTSQEGTSQLVVQNLVGSYIIQPSQATCIVPSEHDRPICGRKNVKGRSQTPPTTTGTPLCYYWVDPKDNDPTSGCVTPSPPFPVVSSDSESISVESVAIKDVFA